jgi:hypothetical protein
VIWQLRKNQEIFRFESWEIIPHFCELDKALLLPPPAPFLHFHSQIRVVVGPPIPRAQLMGFFVKCFLSFEKPCKF